MKTFKVVKVDYSYCKYLRDFDYRVSYNAGLKELRPFLGVIFNIGKIEYFAPLSSPKPKHLKMQNIVDLVRIDGGRLGVINFNNMIPVMPNNYEVFNLNKKTSDLNEQKRLNLLRIQLDWLNGNIYLIRGKAIKLYDKYQKNKLPESVKNRCCNFPLLEEKCHEYNKIKANNCIL